MHLKKISRELRRQLFIRYKRRHIRSRSRSPYRNCNHEEQRPHGGCRGQGRRSNDRDPQYHDNRMRRPRSRSPGRRRGQSKSPGGKRNKAPVREGSTKRRAKIEKWNREKEQADSGNKNNNDECADNGYTQNGGHYYEHNDKQQQEQQSPQQGGYDYWSCGHSWVVGCLLSWCLQDFPDCEVGFALWQDFTTLCVRV